MHHRSCFLRSLCVFVQLECTSIDLASSCVACFSHSAVISTATMSLDSTNEPSAVHHCYDSDYEASSLQLVQALAKDPECKNLDTAVVEAHHAYPATKAILRRGAQRAFKAYTITIPNSIVPLALALAYPISSRTLEPLASYSSSCPPHLRRSTLAHFVRSGNPTRYPEAEHNDQTSSERVKSGRILDRPPYTAGERGCCRRCSTRSGSGSGRVPVPRGRAAFQLLWAHPKGVRRVTPAGGGEREGRGG